MARRQNDEPSAPRRHSPARTPEERETVLINKSLKLIENQIDDGTVSAAVLSQFAKLGSSRERLEQERITHEVQVLRQKVKTMEAAVDIKNLMNTALEAFRGYTGEVDGSSGDDNDEY